LNAGAPILSGTLKIPHTGQPLTTAQEFDMSHAASSFAPTGHSRLTPVARFAMVMAVLVAMIVAGSAMFGHSSSVAASHVGTAMPDAALQLASTAGTDLSVPQASAVFSRQEPAAEETCPTF
jgi:hypothetical protein